MPISNESRVRVDDFSKNMTSVRPARRFVTSSRLRAAARLNMVSISVRERSSWPRKWRVIRPLSGCRGRPGRALKVLERALRRQAAPIIAPGFGAVDRALYTMWPAIWRLRERYDRGRLRRQCDHAVRTAWNTRRAAGDHQAHERAAQLARTRGPPGDRHARERSAGR